MLFALGEELAQPGVEGRGGLAGHGVVGADGAALLDHLTRRVEARDALEAGPVEPLARGGDLLFERVHGRPPPEKSRFSVIRVPSRRKVSR